MNPIAIRLLAQQLAAPQFSAPVSVVAHMGTIQAQDYRMMRWAVALRTRRPTAKAFKEAYNAGQMVRLHLLRGTWQLIAAEDYGWMMALCAPLAERTIKGWMKANKVEIGQEELKRVRQILIKTCEKKESASKKDFAEALQNRGIEMDSHRLS